jgi:hypothetical protein
MTELLGMTEFIQVKSFLMLLYQALILGGERSYASLVAHVRKSQ